MRNEWSPSSLRQYPAEQQPDWPDEEQVSDVLREISDLPPLVFAGEARTLREQLEEVCNGKAIKNELPTTPAKFALPTFYFYVPKNNAK